MGSGAIRGQKYKADTQNTPSRYVEERKSLKSEGQRPPSSFSGGGDDRSIPSPSSLLQRSASQKPSQKYRPSVPVEGMEVTKVDRATMDAMSIASSDAHLLRKYADPSAAGKMKRPMNMRVFIGTQDNPHAVEPFRTLLDSKQDAAETVPNHTVGNLKLHGLAHGSRRTR